MKSSGSLAALVGVVLIGMTGFGVFCRSSRSWRWKSASRDAHHDRHGGLFAWAS
ncbi:MAG: hypothetical protein R3C16_13755 [Hyphomonadaceae bacterium]